MVPLLPMLWSLPSAQLQKNISCKFDKDLLVPKHVVFEHVIQVRDTLRLEYSCTRKSYCALILLWMKLASSFLFSQQSPYEYAWEFCASCITHNLLNHDCSFCKLEIVSHQIVVGLLLLDCIFFPFSLINYTWSTVWSSSSQICCTLFGMLA